MALIEKLTPEQELEKERYRQHRFEAALAPVRREEAEQITRELLKMVGFEMPFMWAESPWVANAIIASMNGYNTKKPQYKLSKKTLELARAALEREGMPFDAHGCASMENAWFCGNGFSIGWITFYSFMLRIIGPRPEISEDSIKKLNLLERLCECAGLIYSFDKITILVEKPLTWWSTRMIAENPVLHRADGPAIQYQDMEAYYWRGTFVPKKFIMEPDSIHSSEALTWENTEQRLALCEIKGWEKILKDLKPKVVDENPDPRFGRLLEVDLPGAPKTRFLHAKCGTGRWITLQVPNTCKTALEAGARTYNVSPDLYKTLRLRT